MRPVRQRRGVGRLEGDGDLDLLVTRLGDPVQLFVNDGGGRSPTRPRAAAVSVSGANGASFADYDNDGDADVVIVARRVRRAAAQRRAGRFADVSADGGHRRRRPLAGSAQSWGDFDADGHVDLYVTNYMQCTGEWDTEEEIIANVAYYADTPVPQQRRRDVQRRQLGGSAPTTDTNGAGFAATWFDYNDDNRLDLYLANDFVGVSPDHNHLWRNDGPAATAGRSPTSRTSPGPRSG